MPRDRFVRTYVEALGLVCLYATSTKTRTRIAHGRKPAGAALVVGYCRGDRAEMVMMAVRGERPADVHDAGRMVFAAAEQLGVVLQTESEVRVTAEMVTEHVESVFAGMMRAGQLRALNSRFRAERLARAAEGRGMVSYSRWLGAEKAKLIRSTAEAVRSSPGARHAIGLALLPIAAE